MTTDARIAKPNYLCRQTPVFWPGAVCPKSPVTRMLGAEIEVSTYTTQLVACALNTAIAKWGAEVHTDCAFELCTAPAGGTRWVEQVEEFCALFADGLITAGPTCGCHIHIDARDITPIMIHRFLQLVCHIEPILYNMVPIARRSNSYCNPSTPLFKGWLTRMRGFKAYDLWLLDCIYGTEKVVSPEKRLEAVKKSRSKHGGISPRYLSFNLKPYFGHGTVECRLLEGCVNPIRIINWGVLLAAIMDTAKQSDQTTLDALLRLPPLATVLRISPSRAHKLWITRTLRALNSVVQASYTIPHSAILHSRRMARQDKARYLAGIAS